MTPAPPREPRPRARPDARRRDRRRRQVIRRRRALAGLLVVGVVAVVVIAITSAGGSRPGGASASHAARGSLPAARAPFPVHEVDLTYVDFTRSMSPRGRAPVPRRLVTRVLVPTAPSGHRVPGAFPLIVFGHGFALSPRTYWPLLHAWARAGYVVAAPVFPLENRAAPGGPNEVDLSNQPADMSFVITRLLAASAADKPPLGGLIDANRIAVAGHSDGGDTALAVADGPNRDHRVSAAVVMAGAEIPGLGLDSSGAPLLAIQGTADPVNPPSATDAFFAALAGPKFLLRLLGASHIPPYSSQQPQLGVVERVTLAFLALYLKGDRTAASALTRAGTRARIAALSSAP
jgi:predicted dienelactone hydrolase